MIINVQGVQGVQGGRAGSKATSRMVCAGCAGFQLNARARACARRLVLLNFQMTLPPCTSCTPCTCLFNQVVKRNLTLHMCSLNLHMLKNKVVEMVNKKRLQWEMIKEQAPEVANWLGFISKTFGKPAAMQVILHSGEVVESGCFSLDLNFDRMKNEH